MSTVVLPLNVAALRVNSNDARTVAPQFKGRIARFENAVGKSFVTGDMLVQPLDSEDAPAEPLGPGIHLHWALPDLFARGAQNSPGATFTFPPAPNRWLVTRYLTRSDDPITLVPTGPQVRQWIVDSDAVLTAPARDSDNVTRPSVPIPIGEPSPPSLSFLGRVLTSDAWPAPPVVKHLPDFSGPDDSPLALTAMGFSGPAFSAYYPECRSAFGFWDTFADVPDLARSVASGGPVRFRVSYHVSGWVCDPADDPLHELPAEAWTTYAQRKEQCRAADVPIDVTPADVVVALLDQEHRLGISPAAVPFTISDEQDLTSLDAPNRTICSGVVADVLWDTTANPGGTYFLGEPVSTGAAPTWTDDVRLAIGNTTGEGLSALLKADSGDANDDEDVLANYEFLLNALQAGLLAEIEQSSDRIVNLEEVLHRSAFSRVPGGLVWVVLPAGTDPGSDEQPILPLPVAIKLAALNGAQEAYDGQRERLATLRRQIYLDWFRYIGLYAGGVSDPNVSTSTLSTFVGDELKAVSAAAARVGVLPLSHDTGNQEVTGLTAPSRSGSAADAVWQAYNDLLQALPADAGWTLRGVPAPAYWLPADPVLVIEGSRVRGVRRNGTGDRTVIRTTTQLIESLTVQVGASGFTVEARSLAPQVSLPAQFGAPDELNLLLAEAALLVPANAAAWAAALADLGGAENPATADPNGVAAALLSAVGAVNPLLAPATGLYQTIHAPGFLPTPNMSMPVVGSQPMTVQFTNASGTALPPPAVAWAAPELLTDFSTDRVDPFLPVFLTWRVTFTPLTRAAGVSYSPDNLTRYFVLDDDGIDNTHRQRVQDITTGVPVGYAGSTLLAQHPTTALAEQIVRYLHDHPDDPAAEELGTLRDLFTSRQIVSHALGGFTLQQILRTGIPATALRSSGRDAVTTAIQNAATNVADNWYDAGFNNQAPIAGGTVAAANFGPLRAGPISVSDLEIIDAFGQPLRLTTPGAVGPLALTAARTIKAKPGDGIDGLAAVLPPRLALPTRLLFRWISTGSGAGPTADEFVESNSHPATTPVFGWVLPNHLDDNLAFYDADGVAIGSFGVEHGANVYRTRAGNTPNASDDLEADLGAPEVNPHLATIMRALAAQRADFVADLLATVLTSESWIHPTATARDGGLSVLVGRPLALVRASLAFTTEGLVLPVSPADTRDTDAFPSDLAAHRVAYGEREAASSANLAAVQIPVRLGDVANLDDGLVGYFLEAPGEALGPPFYSPYAPGDAESGVRRPRAAGNEQHEPIATTLNAAPVTVVMLVDPRAGVHATTGLLPVVELSIPPDQYESALRSLSVTFTCRPVLAGRPELTVPLPAISGQKWAWVPPQGAPSPLTSHAVDAAPVSDYGPQIIQEGWLQLSPAQVPKEQGDDST